MLAATDQYTGTPVAGDRLKVMPNGKLAVAGASDVAVAVCTKAVHTVRHLWKDHDVIEILTL